jgi:UDP-glucose 4-epimerase
VTRIDLLVTGGAGFIGSHLVDTLMANEANISVIDNLNSGKLENIKRWLDHRKFKFIRGDLLNATEVTKALKGCKIVYHLAANPEVRVSSISPNIHFQQNVVATYNLLEAVRKIESVKALVFTSSSTVYGDAVKIPTPENYTPLEPISIYGATKLACEALITAYTYTYGFKTVIYRLANIVGPRSEHGVIYDFIQKLKKNPKKLEILGDGTQSKSYLHANDCINAMILGLERSKNQLEVYNVGSNDRINVKNIAQIVIQEMGLKNVKLTFSGGVKGGRGWIGDVKNMLLDTNKLNSLGWKPELNSEQAIRKTVQHIISETPLDL